MESPPQESNDKFDPNRRVLGSNEIFLNEVYYWTLDLPFIPLGMKEVGNVQFLSNTKVRKNGLNPQNCTFSTSTTPRGLTIFRKVSFETCTLLLGSNLSVDPSDS